MNTLNNLAASQERACMACRDRQCNDCSDWRTFQQARRLLLTSANDPAGVNNDDYHTNR